MAQIKLHYSFVLVLVLVAVQNVISDEVSNSTTSPASPPSAANVSVSSSTAVPSSGQAVLLAEKIARRRQHIVDMVKESWEYYSTKKWAEDQGKTIMAAMPSLWLMDLQDEFSKGRTWIQINLDTRIDLDRDESAHLTVKNYLGSLLSLYALTNDSLFLNKSKEIAHRLRKSYLPVWDRPNIAASNEKIVAATREWAEQVLEYRYLSNLTGDDKYMNRVRTIENYLEANQFPAKHEFEDHLEVYRLAAKVKLFLQSNGNANPSLLTEYKRVIANFEAHELIVAAENGLIYVRKHNESSMLNSDCHLGAILTRGSQALQLALNSNTTISAEEKTAEERLIEHHRNLGEKLTQTCYLATNGTKSGLTPPKFTVAKNVTQNVAAATNETQSVASAKVEGSAGEFIFEPHLPESYLVLYRATRDNKYRQWAWALTKAIYENANLGLGKYKGVLDVQSLPTRKRTSKLPTNLFHATMRLIYLTYSDPDTVVPLDKWVISEAGFPLPVLT